jgi:hypothetical protein
MKEIDLIFLCVLCEIFVFSVVKFYHEAHKGNTKSTKYMFKPFPAVAKIYYNVYYKRAKLTTFPMDNAQK